MKNMCLAILITALIVFLLSTAFAQLKATFMDERYCYDQDEKSETSRF